MAQRSICDARHSSRNKEAARAGKGAKHRVLAVYASPIVAHVSAVITNVAVIDVWVRDIRGWWRIIFAHVRIILDRRRSWIGAL